MAFVFGLQTLKLIDFTKIFQSKGLKPKNNDDANFYECCVLTKKSISNRGLLLNELLPCHRNTTNTLYTSMVNICNKFSLV